MNLLVLALLAAAVSGYLLAARHQAWSRARRSSVYRRPLVAYAAVLAALVVVFPAVRRTREVAFRE